LAQAEHPFFHPEHFTQFDEATAISNNKSFFSVGDGGYRN